MEQGRDERRRADALGSVLVALATTSLFELAKESFLPAASRWQAHAITIAYVGMAAAVFVTWLHRKGDRFWRQVDALADWAQRNEAALQALVDAIPEPAFLIDRRHTILTLNDALAERFGRTPAVAIDVADLESAREQIERKEELLRFGLQAARLGVWEWDIGADVVTVSPEARALLGGPERIWRVSFATFLDYLDERDREHVAQHLRAAAAGRPFAGPLRFRGRPDPRRPMRWVEIQGRVYESDAGRLRMVGTVGDATTRIESEARRRRAEHAVSLVTQGTAGHTGQDFFSSLVEALARSLGTRWVVAGRFKEDGGAFETMASWADGPAPNVAFALDHPRDRSTSRQWLARVADLGASCGAEDVRVPYVIEVPIVARDGRAVGLVAAVDDEPLEDLDTMRLVLALSAARAGAEIQRLDKEDEILRLNADLERRVAERTRDLTAANRELEAFSYSVSHDLRAPLRSIDGFALALLEDHGHLLAPGARQYIDIVRQESQRMGQLIDDLLGLARLARGTLNRGLVDVSALASRIVEGLQRRDERREVAVVVAPDMLLYGDAKLLRIALENLIGNAWKFTARSPDARIEISVAADGTNRSIVVQDNGAGFDPRLAGKLFQPFARLHAASDYEGTGIGLATVARIIKRHGGAVRAESEPGAGATFICTLPDAAVPPAPTIDRHDRTPSIT